MRVAVSLLAVLSQLLVTQPPVLPKLPGGKQHDECAENEMPVPERASFCVTKDECEAISHSPSTISPISSQRCKLTYSSCARTSTSAPTRIAFHMTA